MKKKSINNFSLSNPNSSLTEVIVGGESVHTTYSGPNDTVGDDWWDGCRMIYFER